MKKQIGCLLSALLLTTFTQALANPVGQIDAGAFNRAEQNQINNYKLERSYIQTLDHVTKDERIYDATVEEDVAREGVLYNPHFLLEKIN